MIVFISIGALIFSLILFLLFRINNYLDRPHSTILIWLNSIVTILGLLFGWYTISAIQSDANPGMVALVYALMQMVSILLLLWPLINLVLVLILRKRVNPLTYYVLFVCIPVLPVLLFYVHLLVK